MPTLTEQREQVFDSFRKWGYLAADLDPLGLARRISLPELEGNTEEHHAARSFYCGTIGAEFSHIVDAARRRWIQERMEAPPHAPDRAHLLERLASADIFEQFIQARYPGAKRFVASGRWTTEWPKPWPLPPFCAREFPCVSPARIRAAA